MKTEHFEIKIGPSGNQMSFMIADDKPLQEQITFLEGVKKEITKKIADLKKGLGAFTNAAVIKQYENGLKQVDNKLTMLKNKLAAEKPAVPPPAPVVPTTVLPVVPATTPVVPTASATSVSTVVPATALPTVTATATAVEKPAEPKKVLVEGTLTLGDKKMHYSGHVML
jgi:hypothetical protein